MAVNASGIATGTAAASVVAAQAASTLGTTEAEIACQLTIQAVKEQPAVVIPLLLLSFTSIAEGLAAYVASLAAGKAADSEVQDQWQTARKGASDAPTLPSSTRA